MKKILFLSFVTIVLLTSCKKDRLTNESELSTSCKTDSGFISSIKSSACTSESPYKFQATLNSKQICFDRLINPDAFNVDRWKINYYSSVIYSTRVNADSTIMINMVYSSPAFKASSLPFTVSPSNACEGITIAISLIKPYRPNACEPDENTIWFSTRYTLLTLNCKIISYKDDIIEGIFDGKCKSKTGDIFVTGGYFNIKLRIEEE
jgi:hypothetical protein